ncbi:MAG TPA: carboxypeptidase-like regulatory domain-containing protein [Terracidiphilus sp.]|nr:carboxypeptidase-like regulatory domain-containing protein [Terracidiphilus sp.]
MYKASQSAKAQGITPSVERTKIRRVFALWQGCLLGCTLLLSGTGVAQLSTASLSGVVRDSSGAVVPNTKIVLRNVATAVENTTTTNGVGAYLFADITPGRYTVQASVTGFAEQLVPAFTLAVGQVATIDFALTVGSQSTVVTVQGVTPQLEASTANLGTVIATRQVNDLPLNGRDFTQLLTLTPGISPVNNGQGGQGQGSYATPEPNNQNSTIPSVNGQGSRSDYFFTDGLSNFGAFHSVYAVPPIIDEIQEFKVVSHADSAEYGGVTGGVVNVVTKSGTNDFHGSVFEYFRNAGMDAHQAFTGTGSAPSFTQNEFGGVIGGPVRLPKLYNGKNRTFFFGSYQGFRFSQTEAKFIRVPTAAQLAGDESDWPTQIFNPFTTVPDTLNPGEFTRQPYQGNQITPDPNMVAWAKFVYPAAGPVLDAAGDDATDSTPTTQTINQWTARIDQKIGQNDSAWFRYSRDTSVLSESGGVPGLINSVVVPNRNYGGSYVHVFSPSLVLQVQFGRTTVGDNAILEFTKSTQGLISQIGFSPSFVGDFAASPGRNFLPGLDIAGGGVGGNASYASPGENYALHPDVPNANQYSGVLTKTFGRHTLDIGGGFITNKFYSPITTDNITYAAEQTGNPENSAQPGDALASFLLNVPEAADRRNVVTETRPGGVMSEFIQDSWRATSKLTINAGLRYDLTLFPPVGTAKQIGVNGGPETGDIDFNTGNYIIQKLPPPCTVRGYAPCIPGDSTLPANVVVSPNEKIMHNTPTNVGPHLGFALKIRNRTVIHGAAGVVYDNWAGVLQLAQNIDGLWPDIGQQEPTGLNEPTSSSPTPTVTSQNPLASSGSGTFVPAPTPFTQQGFEYDPRMKNPYSEQWNFGVQQLIGSSTTATVNYVGSSTHRLDVGGIYGGAVTPGPGPIAPRQLFPYITPTFYDRSTGRGNYNALQASLERRFTNGLSYSVSYTWSKSIDVGGDGYFGVEGGVPQNAYDPGQYDRSVSGLDLKHLLAVSTLYEVPIGKGKRFSTGSGALDYILGNWQINTIFQAHSGSPFTPLDGNDVSNTGSLGFVSYEHLNVIGNPALSHRSAAEWFNTAAYAVPTFGTYGDAGRNSLRGPNYWDLDSSVFRQFPVGEGRQFEFRAEAYNLANHVNLGQPDGTITDGPSFGTISGTAYNNTSLNRQLEIAVKFIF